MSKVIAPTTRVKIVEGCKIVGHYGNKSTVPGFEEDTWYEYSKPDLWTSNPDDWSPWDCLVGLEPGDEISIRTLLGRYGIDHGIEVIGGVLNRQCNYDYFEIKPMYFSDVSAYTFLEDPENYHVFGGIIIKYYEYYDDNDPTNEFIITLGETLVRKDAYKELFVRTTIINHIILSSSVPKAEGKNAYVYNIGKIPMFYSINTVIMK